MAYTITAKRWEPGWELHIHRIGVTQTRLLADAEAMVGDYLAADDVPDAETAEVAIRPDRTWTVWKTLSWPSVRKQNKHRTHNKKQQRPSATS